VSGLAGWAGFEGAGLSPCFTNSAVIRATRHRAGLTTPTDARLVLVRRPVACFVSWDVSCIFRVSSSWSGAYLSERFVLTLFTLALVLWKQHGSQLTTCLK
jgi:hypothetical protein